MLRTYTSFHNKKLLKLMQPWHDSLAVKHFFYYQMTKSGHHHFIGSHLPFLEYYYSENMFQNCPYLLHPDNYQSGVSLSKCIPDPDFKNSQDLISNKFNMNLGLTIIEKHPNGIRGFVFASNSEIPYLNTLYLNELPLFQLFIRRFKEEFKPVLEKMEDNFIDFASVMGKSFFTKKLNVVAKVKDREQMLKKIGIDLPIGLTKADIKLVKEITRGCTAREISENLYLSKRTVEDYIDKLKEIFHCSSKSQLVQKTQELLSLGYFE